ncbi:MAG: hypothetical protein ABR974_08520 [Bacteroidales bacterium]|jgi:hypothetical protein
MTQKTKTYFWLRLIAFTIDLSVIYGIAFIVWNLLQLVPVYVPIARLTLIISIFYFPTITLAFRTTAGKVLCRLSVESKSKIYPSITLLLRELVYKQLFYIIPVCLLMVCFKLAWLSPYFEIFYCFILTPILFIIFLFQKRPWYDAWAKTTVIKNAEYDIVNARNGLALLICISLVIFCIRLDYYVSTNSVNDPFIPKHSKNAISPYVSFLEKQEDAKDYIFRLFDKNDIVILCEREHPEMTQYDFVFDLISDKRFIEKAGNVFSEIGSRTQQSNLDSLMNTAGLTDEELDIKLCQILRDYSSFPIWENTNYFDYFKKSYALNQQLPKEKRIKHFFADVECNWKEIKNKNDYTEKVKSNILRRDEVLADLIIMKYEQISVSNPERKKCLVIMNYRHAFGPVNVRLGDNSCASYIMKKYPDKSANVLINTVNLSLGLSNPGHLQLEPAQKSPIKIGMWDNAFKAIGNRSLGFDFKESPFGEDEFDLYFSPAGKLLKYKDVFTGYIFYKPLEKHYNSLGFKNIIKNGFDAEIINRANIIDDNSSDPDDNIKSVKEKIKKFSEQEITINTKPYQTYSSVIDLLFGTILLGLGLASGLIFYLTRKKIANTRHGQ